MNQPVDEHFANPFLDWDARMSVAGLAKSVQFSLSCAVLLSVAGTGLAQAQIVNDPAASMLMMNMVSRFQPVKETAKEADQKKELAMPLELPSKAQLPQEPTKTTTSGSTAVETEPLPAMLEPELDTQAADNSPSGKEPVKARAVMVDINSNNLNYDKDLDVYIATGSVHMIISEQNSELFTDKLIYDQNQDLAIAEGNVVIVKNGQRTEGKYAKIDLTRKSALITDPVTTISAVRVKAQEALVNNNEIIMENGRFIISGIVYQQLAAQGGLKSLGQNTGKGSQQAKLRREYSKKAYQDRAMRLNTLTYDQQKTFEDLEKLKRGKESFEEAPDKVSRFNIKAKEIEVVRHEDGYDDITLKRPSLYAGKYKLFTFPNTDFSYDNPNKNIQYLGPDVGAYQAYGGAYAGPGWDFHVGRGSVRVSPFVSYGSPGFWSANGRTGKQIDNGFGLGGLLHYRDADTSVDLGFNSRVGSPVLFADRRITDNTHVMASYNDGYVNGLLGQMERPNYIAQVTDYRVLKDFKKFQLSSFESIGYARDNFFPNFRENYFVEAGKDQSPQMLGRAQVQLQLQNTAPLLSMGKYASMGLRAQLITSAYSSADFVGLGRIGPTLHLNLLGSRLQTHLGYTVSHTLGKSPFVFDSYYGGAQNLSVNNLVRVNKFLSVGNNGSFSLNRDNARNALAVGNSFYMMVGPTDVKATIGYDFINRRSYFGFNYFPGANNSVVNFDKMRIMQPANFNQQASTATF
ncbi:hypothetical protein [Vampirovibrio sp.]|uniref:hypothetical protein n=1 Tax=Vampirovibrio sp. TaxID=2717857 RepID=UPI0035942630